jgi:two-component system, cell cycle sensor histidine kinase and response regulator CckA
VYRVIDDPLDGRPKTTSVGAVPMDRLRAVFDGMFDGVWLVAPDGTTTYANGAMARLLGTTRDEMHGRPLANFLDEAVRADTAAFLARLHTHAGERIELRFRRADGGDLYGVVAGSPIETAEGVFVGAMLNVSDVTGKRSIDAQMIQNQRLEAIGEFAGGIAHDFNNLLTSIQGYTELARADLPAGDPARADLDQVLASAELASAITRKLLAFTRRQVLAPVDVDPGQVIADLVPILRPLMGDNIDLALHIDVDHAWITVDPTQLEQVIVNLAVNARDAMPEGGTIKIAVGNVVPTDPQRPDADLTAGPFVRVSVSDTGVGMDEATRARAFDPFFTTKGPGRGTGLGLSTVFGIVAQSGGQIIVETAPGMGSAFHIDLPRAGTAVRPVPRPAEPPALHRSGVVLLVEDDPPVRRFVRRTLEGAGYRVLESVDGAEAVRLSEAWDDEIDVLLTDIVMPGAHGRDVAATIRAQRPHIGVVFMSGYAQDAIERDGKLTASGRFLSKPFSGDALKRSVRRAADASRHPAP